MEKRRDRCEALHAEFERRWLARDLPALPALAEAEVAAAREAWGERHPALVRALLDQALAFQAAGQAPQAQAVERAAQELLEAIERETAGTPEDPRRAALLSFQADRLWPVLGDREEVRSRYEEALRILRSVHGPRHPDVGDAIARLGEMAFVAARFAEAEGLYRQALDAYAGDPSADERPLAGRSLQGLAQALVHQGRPLEALPYFERALAVHERAGGDRQPLYFLLIFFADALQAAGRPAEAESLRARAARLLPAANPGALGYHV